jgi:hypothetical protein
MFMATKLRISLSIRALVFATFAARGQTAPLKPGLWEVHVDRETNGQKAPDMSERLKNMPPDRRAQIEAMMKQRGVDAGGNVSKVCQTRESLDSKKFVNPVADCKTAYSTRTNSTWKSHTSCPQNHLESDAETTFTDPENYTTKITSVSQSGGKTSTSHITQTGKWLSADCGDIKPLSANP